MLRLKTMAFFLVFSVGAASALAQNLSQTESMTAAYWAHPPPLTAQNIAQAMPHVIAELKEHVRTVPRDTTVFHWADSKALLYKAPASGPKDAQIVEYLNKYTSRYFDSSNGEGLYFAQDPSSSAYAGTTLLMAVIEADTRFLDITTPASDATSYDAHFSPESNAELAHYGCNTQFYDVVFRREKCMEVKKLLTSYLQVKFYTYSYEWRTLPQFCRPSLQKVALVVFDSSAFVTSATAVFDPYHAAPESFDMAAGQLAQLSSDDSFGASAQEYAKRQISAILPKVVNTEKFDFQSWAKNALFDCAWR